MVGSEWGGQQGEKKPRERVRFFWNKQTKGKKQHFFQTDHVGEDIAKPPCCFCLVTAAQKRHDRSASPHGDSRKRLSLRSEDLGMPTWPQQTTAEKHPIFGHQCFDWLVVFCHPSEKNIRQTGNLPQIGMKNKKSLKPPPSWWYLFLFQTSEWNLNAG